ncbi:hypothetical protein Tco_0852262 [Tanacetum coccineum]
MEEINNSKGPMQALFRAWERFKDLLMKCPQHYLTMQEVILFYNGLDVPLVILDSRVPIPPNWAGCSKLASRNGKDMRNSVRIKEIRASTDAAIRNQEASIKTLEIQIGQMSKVLQERGFRSLPNSTETNPRDQVKSISTAKADFSEIRHIGCGSYAREAQDVKILDAYDHTLPQKEKDLESFTLPCFIHNICFDKALIDLGASVKMDDPNITIEEYIRLEEEKAHRHSRTFNWQTARFGKVKYYEDEDDCFSYFKTEFPAIVFDNTLTLDTALPCEPTSSPPNENKIDFRISLDESDDEDYTVIFDENSFSYKIIFVNDLKKDSENDKIFKPSSSEPTVDYLDDLDYFNDFENEFPAIVYNDGLTSKPDLEIEPPVSSEHDSKSETSLSKYDEEEQNVSHFSNSFPLDEIFPNDPKTIKDSDDNIDIAQPYGCNKVNGSNELSRKIHDKSNKVFNEDFFIITLDANIVSWNYFSWMPLNLIINLYVPFGIPFDPKLFYKDGINLGQV